MSYLEDSGTRDKYFYVVGGGPVTADFAKDIKADGWSRTGFDAVEMCKQLMKQCKPGAQDTLIIDSELN